VLVGWSRASVACRAPIELYTHIIDCPATQGLRATAIDEQKLSLQALSA
jgi:hypothetical protein